MISYLCFERPDNLKRYRLERAIPVFFPKKYKGGGAGDTANILSSNLCAARTCIWNILRSVAHHEVGILFSFIQITFRSFNLSITCWGGNKLVTVI